MELKVSKSLDNLPKIDYRNLVELQGDLKTLSEADFIKLKTNLFGDGAIPANGFMIPFFVWFEPKTKKPYIIDGHQRLRVLQTVDSTPYELPYIEIEAKNKKEAKQKLLLVSSQYGKVTRDGWDEFAFDLDTNWVQGLTTFEAFTLPPLETFGDYKPEGSNAINSNPSQDYDQENEFEEAIEDAQNPDSNRYTSKIAAPTYEPKNEQPAISDLFNSNKANEFIAEIKATQNISKDERAFLLLAAHRHTVFNYEKIADYYAHASKDMQLLMEKSALVIIDFNMAIEQGYIKLSEEIQNMYLNKE